MDLADELEQDIDDLEPEVEELAAETEEVVKQEVEEPQPEPESKPEEKHESKQVPLHELVAERKKRQEAQRQQEESNKKVDLVLEKLRALEEEKNKPVEPEFESDPFGYTFHQQEQIRQTAESNAQNVEQLQQQFTQYQQLNNASIASDQMFAEYATQKEDFSDALAYLRQVNKNSLIMQGYDAEEVEANYLQGERQINAQLVMQGHNPAEMAYKYAQLYGYQPKTAQESDITDSNEADNAEKELNRLEKGQKHAKIGSSGGASKLDEVSSESGIDEIQAALNDIFN